MTLDRPVLESLPPPLHIRHRLGDALREVELLRALLRLAERAEAYRHCDRNAGYRRREVSHAR